MEDRKKVFQSIIDGIYPMSDHSFRKLAELVDFRTISKGTDFVQRSRRDGWEYFITDGICRSYVLDPEGEEITISFFQSPGVLTPHIARTEKGRSLLNFQAITNCEIGSFGEEALIELMIENLEIRFFANTVLQEELRRKVSKEIGLSSMTARERLIKFRADFDGLENLIPHPMIASYLGITNISLSRLRRELSNL